MFSRRIESLRAQLLLWLLMPLLALMLLNAWIGNRLATSTANQAFDRLLLASADAIAEDVEVREGVLAVDLPYAALQLLESNIQERIYYRVVAPDGKTLTGYEDLPLPSATGADRDEPVLYSAAYRGDTIHLVALNKRLYGTDFRSPVIVIVAETGEARSALSRRIQTEGMVREGGLILAAVVMVWFGLHRGLAPLRRLRDSLRARDASDLSPIGWRGVQSEVRPLIAALNEHTARIDRLLLGRQQFISDASHQMRTPLAEMMTQIDYCLRHGDPDLLRTTLEDVRQDIDRLARLIAQMLSLARSDPGMAMAGGSERVDLVELARTCSLDFVNTARSRGIDIEFESPSEPVTVRARAPLLREMVANLVENALVHGGHGRRICIRVLLDGGPVLEVEDDGVGIPPEERSKVFDRFYRLNPTQAPGSGLGLSIVKNIAAAHRATVELGSGGSGGTGGAGLLVRVRFTAT